MITDAHTHVLNQKVYDDYFRKSRRKITKVLAFSEIGTVLEDLLKLSSIKDNLYVVGAIDMEKDVGSQLAMLEKLLRDKKIVGLKLLPGYQHFYPSDEKVYPIAELCQKYHKPLIFHSGDVYNPEGGAILKYSNPIYIDELAVRFPKCKIIIAHLGFPYLLEAANIVSKNENVYADISGTIDNCSLSPAEKKSLLNQYAEDLKRVFAYFPNVKKKVMFGTDYSGEETSLNQVLPYIKLVNRVFSKAESNSAFSELAEKLFFN